MKCYAGVGSRQTPPEILSVMTNAARALRALGWMLRSGHAPGADQAFGLGAGNDAEIFLPWPRFEHQAPKNGKVYSYPKPRAYDIAQDVHPRWENVKSGAKALHARNAHQVLGWDLETPVRFLLCWTERGLVVGGTATAIRIAHRNGVEVRNLAEGQTLWRVERMIESVLAEL